MNKDRTDMLWGNRVSGEYITNIALRIVQERIDRDHQLKNEILCEEIKRLGYVGAGKKYGVSDHAIRKWKRLHESQFEIKKVPHREQSKEKGLATAMANPLI